MNKQKKVDNFKNLKKKKSPTWDKRTLKPESPKENVVVEILLKSFVGEGQEHVVPF